jgi:hypothetical protein
LAAEQPRTTAVLSGGLDGGATLTGQNNWWIFPGPAAGSTNTATGFGGITVGSANLGLPPTSVAEANQWPDIVANLRIDQAWGSAQIMGAIHDVAAQYYGTVLNTTLGHPSDEIGWAVGAGIKLLAPMIGQGDYLQAQVNYTQGARKYVDFSYTNMYSMFNGGNYGIGIGSDGVFAGSSAANGTSIELTTAWGVNAAYEHFWSKQWQTSVYGAYTATTYNANANAYMCNSELRGGNFSIGIKQTGAMGTLVGPAFGNANGVACNNNFNVWNIGTRTQWNIDSSTYLGVDVVYQKLETALAGLQANYGNGVVSNTAGSPRDVADQSAWMVQFRVHRNFYP